MESLGLSMRSVLEQERGEVWMCCMRRQEESADLWSL